MVLILCALCVRLLKQSKGDTLKLILKYLLDNAVNIWILIKSYLYLYQGDEGLEKYYKVTFKLISCTQ